MQENAVNDQLEACAQPCEIVVTAVVSAPADRETVDITECANRLDALYRNLQKSNLTVGYLESQLADYRVQAEALPEAEQELQRLAELQHENEELERLAEQAKVVEALAKQNEAIRELLRNKERRRVSWWSFVGACLFGSDEAERLEPFSMGDYHAMIQRHLQH